VGYEIGGQQLKDYWFFLQPGCSCTGLVVVGMLQWDLAGMLGL
jgi:hypothetical protein